jgi:hypothetical protein
MGTGDAGNTDWARAFQRSPFTQSPQNAEPKNSSFEPREAHERIRHSKADRGESSQIFLSLHGQRSVAPARSSEGTGQRCSRSESYRRGRARSEHAVQCGKAH